MAFLYTLTTVIVISIMLILFYVCWVEFSSKEKKENQREDFMADQKKLKAVIWEGHPVKRQRWRWKLVYKNGKTACMSEEPFPSEKAAKVAFELFADTLKAAKITMETRKYDE